MPNLPELCFEPVLTEQGVYLAPGRANWQIGRLALYPDRLLFEQPRGVLFEMPVAWLLDVAVERKHYVIVRKPAVAVTFQDPRLRNPTTAWFLTPLLGQWVAQLTALLHGDSAPSAGDPRDLPGDPCDLPGDFAGDFSCDLARDFPSACDLGGFSGDTNRRSGDGAYEYDRWDSRTGARSGTHSLPGAGGPALKLGSLRTGPSRAASSGRAASPGGGSTGGGPSLSLGSLKGAGAPAAGNSPASDYAWGSSRSLPAAEGRVLRPPGAHPHTGSQGVLSPQALARLAAQLDPTSRAILAHLAEVSHANIRDLAEVSGAPGDMAVLFSIRHNINPTAKALLGRPVLFFVESQLDQVTGEMVPFAWWLAGRRGRIPIPHPALYEVHDEGATITVLLELEGVLPDSIRCTAGSRRLSVMAQSPAQHWCTDIDLPAPVAATVQGQRLNNGILSIALAKAPQEDL